MRMKHALVFGLLAACGPDGSFIGDCFEYDSVCVDRETPEHQAWNNSWEGSYSVDRYWVGSEGAYLDWYGNAYKMVLERDGLLRSPFYRTTDMVGEGAMTPGQTNFKAPYTSDETWYFSGQYGMDGDRLTYEGRVSTHGQWIGRFSFSRKRNCLAWRETTRNTCTGEVTSVITNGFEETADEDGLPELEPQISITYAALAPNPVSAGAEVRIRASVIGAASAAWKVSVAPSTDTTQKLAEFIHIGQTLDVQTVAPLTPGTYRVTFSAVSGNLRDQIQRQLIVSE